MSSLKTTQLVVALSLCLLLLGFSYSAEAAARQFTDVAEAVANQQCDQRDYCFDDNVDECNKICLGLHYRGGICLQPPPDASSNREEKIDVNRWKVSTLHHCCCYH
ncbi:hypothetical protein MKW92_040539 [Papaver armeniacum]|nr:hypothetical protein MKW92_037352 [Papaver armeniacum]KAI3942359.1 hypothetical protein MKW92_040539 [Papaver armeniacum]